MQIFTLAEEIAARLAGVSGVTAVVIGGSRGRGTDRPDSDLDLGIYYEPHLPLDLVSLNQIAARLDDTHRPDLLTPIGGWGPWINGGGWLKMGGLEVDFIYRDLAKVRQVIADCCKGIISIHYQPGHPHGFTSHIYMGEVATSRILYDPAGALAELRDATNPYPPGLKQAVIKAFFWECDLALQTARKGAARGDTAYVAGCIFRGLACLLQTLFAINGVYWLNEKGALALADAFSIKPQHLRPSVERAFSSLTSNPTDLLAAVDRLDALIAETGIFLKSG